MSEPTREEWKDWAAVMAAKEFDAESANWWQVMSVFSPQALASQKLQASLMQQQLSAMHGGGLMGLLGGLGGFGGALGRYAERG